MSRRTWALTGALATAGVMLIAACGAAGGTVGHGGDSPVSSSTVFAESGPDGPAAAGPTTTLPGRPGNIYANDGPNDLAPVVRDDPYLIYVPESSGQDVDVINPKTMTVVDRYHTGLGPQHVVPGWDLKTLYAANDLGNSLTPIDPRTGLVQGPNIPVTDPYNMYFTPDGRYAIVVEEARQVLAFRDPHTFALIKALPVSCRGVDHGDFSVDGSFAIFSCEFSGKMVKVDLRTLSVDSYLTIPGSSPQDVKLDAAGTIFYAADMDRGGVYEISAATFQVVGFIPTGADAHGLYVSRDGRYMYVTNRGAGSISVIDMSTRSVKVTWSIPGGGSPDMGNVSPDGTVLWVSGRYNSCVYAISLVDGHLMAKIAVPDEPHGLAVWPQPGKYSLGHTGIMR